MRVTFLIYVVIILILTSCEGFIHMQGHVLDNHTKEPIENVQILLVLRGRDTLRKIQLEYDTMPYNKRIALRKQGLKDDYDFYSPTGLSKEPTPCLTDGIGYFSVGTIFTYCVPACPTCQLVFIKDGYKQLSVKLKSIVDDSVNISLERLTGEAINYDRR
jgi:hypothetical protein